MTDELQQAMIVGHNVGIILLQIAKVPAILTAPILGLFSAGAFFLGAKYERRWNKNNQREPLMIEDLSKILLPEPQPELDYEKGEQDDAQ